MERDRTFLIMRSEVSECRKWRSDKYGSSLLLYIHVRR